MASYSQVKTLHGDAAASAHLQRGWEILDTHIFNPNPPGKADVPVYTVYILGLPEGVEDKALAAMGYSRQPEASSGPAAGESVDSIAARVVERVMPEKAPAQRKALV